ncbi:MAG: ChuX/HutX family heme-like substrate-binding protein [Pseudomonadota bacterium]
MKAEDPVLRARDAAERLGVSEGVLVEARFQAGHVRRLPERDGGFAWILDSLKPIGRVMTLTRNDVCVHETYGAASDVATFGKMGQVTGSIDLRVFLEHWHACYLVAETARSGPRRSLQVFDAAGDAVIKIYVVAETDREAWDALISASAVDTGEPIAYAPVPAPVDPADDEIDMAALRDGWGALDHSHDFHRLLKDTGAGRLQALRLAGEAFAEARPQEAAIEVLEQAAERAIQIMAFAGNRGCIQIYSGPIFTVTQMGPWLNVMDPDFHMHLRLDRVASLWRVTKPTKLRGPITSLELFSAEGDLVLQLFGARAPGEPENPDWRRLLSP